MFHSIERLDVFASGVFPLEFRLSSVHMRPPAPPPVWKQYCSGCCLTKEEVFLGV